MSTCACNFVTDLDELHRKLKQHISNDQHCYQHSADSRHSPPLEFKIGSQAFVKAQFFHTTRPSKKLSKKFLGPYEIIAPPGSHSVILRLLDSLRTVHPVFHVSMLEPAVLNMIPDQVQPPPPPIMVDDKPEFEILEILDTKIDNCPSTCKYCTLSAGWVMKAPTKRPHGYSLPS